MAYLRVSRQQVMSNTTASKDGKHTPKPCMSPRTKLYPAQRQCASMMSRSGIRAQNMNGFTSRNQAVHLSLIQAKTNSFGKKAKTEKCAPKRNAFCLAMRPCLCFNFAPWRKHELVRRPCVTP